MYLLYTPHSLSSEAPLSKCFHPVDQWEAYIISNDYSCLHGDLCSFCIWFVPGAEL